MPTHTCLAHEMNGARLTTTHEDVFESHEDALDRLLRRLSNVWASFSAGSPGTASCCVRAVAPVHQLWL